MIKNKIKNIVLTAGHGGGDSGAVSNSGRQEAIQVIKICNYLAQYNNQFPMRANIIVEDAENRLNLAQSIQALNKKFWNVFNNNSADNFLLMEIHQDMNAPHLPIERQKWQIGVYRYEGDNMSKQFASELIENCIANGAYAGSPSRDDFDGSWQKGHYLPWRGFYLGFIQNTKALSMILECGYVSAEHTEEELQKLAWIIYQSLYEMIEGKKLIINNNTNNQEEIMFGQKKEELWNRLITDGGQYMSQDRQAVIRYALDNNDFNYIAGELVGAWKDIEGLHKQIMELKNDVARISMQQDTFLSKQQEILANNVTLENPPVYFEAVEAKKENEVKKISHLTMGNSISDNSVINSGNKIQDIINNTIKKVTGSDNTTMPKVVSENDKTLNRHINQTVTALIIALSTLIVKYMNQALGWDVSVELFNSIINVNFIVDTLTNLISSLFFMISSNNAFSSLTDYLRKIKVNEK